MVRTWLALIGLLWSHPSFAHDQWANGEPVPSWVKTACCGPSDAHHLKPSQVQETQCPSGTGTCYRVEGFRDAVPFSSVQPSQDGEYWAFYRDETADSPQSPMYCLFIPFSL